LRGSGESARQGGGFRYLPHLLCLTTHKHIAGQMIINVSRTKSFQTCQQYAYNWDELRLYPHREADPLVMGEGYHLGSEVITKSANVNEAVQATEQRMRERYAGQTILKEEQADIERNIEWAKHAVSAWAEHYNRADFRVLWPEVSGCVALPGTDHHCWFAHRMLYPDVPFNDDCHRECRIPHYFAFRTDGVIEMYKNVLLLEQKTTSSTARNHFWEKFQLDNQIRGYCYGVWKTTGVLVSGVMVNAIIKHSKQITKDGVKVYQIDPYNVGFEREAVMVGKQDMLDFERELILLANEYEHKFSHPELIVKNPNACYNYNRRCYYWDLCKRFQEPIDGEFIQRKPDYVEENYVKILGLEKKVEA
jgi:hypothetical protein